MTRTDYRKQQASIPVFLLLSIVTGLLLACQLTPNASSTKPEIVDPTIQEQFQESMARWN